MQKQTLAQSNARQQSRNNQASQGLRAEKKPSPSTGQEELEEEEDNELPENPDPELEEDDLEENEVTEEEADDIKWAPESGSQR
ncbi:hypothetical protein ACDQ55_20705 [Chitinophaga sp. 30R24]|uniref:hypothetical protein n=1 Tax=Chitinophaga sp. 30R24 TaxID=3248838 RepID=UPI003B8FAC19